MLANLSVLLLVVAMLLGSIWLSVRSAKSKKTGAKIAGIAGSVVLILLFGALSFFGARGLWLMYHPTRSVTQITVQGTPEQIQRGAYLASVTCSGCHGKDGQRDQPLVGGFNMAADVPAPIGTMIAQNITPGGILKVRSDGELFRLFRTGYNGDNQASPVMSNLPYRNLSDEDLISLIAYMRSLEPVESTGKRGSHLNILGAVLVGAGLMPLQAPVDGVVTAPPQAATPEYGKYVATFGDCVTCHGPDMTGTPPSIIAPNGIPNPRTIVGGWSLDEFIQTMRTGVRPTGQKLNMPWENAAHMSDQDLAALYAYLRSEP